MQNLQIDASFHNIPLHKANPLKRSSLSPDIAAAKGQAMMQSIMGWQPSVDNDFVVVSKPRRDEQKTRVARRM
ncbi:mCG67366 [Mus musculus]|nr:mCG67366 [Mus musculus]